MRLIKAFDVLFIIGAVLAGASVALWLSIWSPDAIVRDSLPLYRKAAQAINPSADGMRIIHDVKLVDPDGALVRFSVSLPAARPDAESAKKLPTLVVITGFRSAHQNLARITAPGLNAVASYDYPYDPKEWKAASLPGRAWIARRVAFRIPDEVAAMIAWIRRQDWADPNRVSLVGVSLGAVALPVIRRRVAAVGQKTAASVMAYGGADLQALARANIDVSPSWLRDIAAWAIWLMLKPLEPSAHLPEISGPFLLINGRDDERLPAESVRLLQELTPQPKTIVTVDGPHIDGSRPETIANTIRIARDWLAERGALNPQR